MSKLPTYADYAEAFTIMAKYGKDDHASIAVEHDIIYVGHDLENMSNEDIDRLEELGWEMDNDLECYYHFV